MNQKYVIPRMLSRNITLNLTSDSKSKPNLDQSTI